MSSILMGVLILGEPFRLRIAVGTVLVIAVIFVFMGVARTETGMIANMDLLGIAGKWALVCGASKGLGFGCAQALVREGVHVVLVARGAEALEAAASKTHRRSRPARRHGGAARGCGHHHGRRAGQGVRKTQRVRHRGDQCGRPAAGRFPRVGPRRVDQGGGRQHAHAHRIDQGDGGRHGGTWLRAHRQHHFERGEGADRHPGPVEWRAQRLDRLRRRRGAHSQAGFGQRDHQQPAARRLRYGPPQGHHGRRGAEDRPAAGGGDGDAAGDHSGAPLRHARGVRRGLCLPVQPACRLHHGPEHPDRWRGVSRHV